MSKYVGYIRVSTRKQGATGLSLEHQTKEINQFISQNGAQLLDIFSDVESGSKSGRGGINKAIALCKDTGATLLVQKLDRLSRSVTFIFALKESGVKFHCIDMPNMDTMTLGVVASFAQREREASLERSNKAIATKKARGVKMGTPQNFNNLGRDKGREAIRERIETDPNRKIATRFILALRQNGKTFTQIAKELTELKIPTLRGGKNWSACSVTWLYNKTKEGKVKKVLSTDLSVVSIGDKGYLFSLDSLNTEIKRLIRSGYSLSSIAKYLNENNVTTQTGGKFYPQTVKRFIDTYSEKRKNKVICSDVLEHKTRYFCFTHKNGAKVKTNRIGARSIDNAKSELLALYPKTEILSYKVTDRNGKELAKGITFSRIDDGVKLPNNGIFCEPCTAFA